MFSLYADDILLLLRDLVSSIPPLMETVQRFSKITGYRVNWHKLEAMPVSASCTSHMVTYFNFKRVQTGMK